MKPSSLFAIIRKAVLMMAVLANTSSAFGAVEKDIFRYITGHVTDENGQGLGNVTVELKKDYSQYATYKAVTDAEGYYYMKYNKDYTHNCYIHISTTGHTIFDGIVELADEETQTKDFTLYGSVTYKAGRRSTIILPVAPDPSAGRYYEYVRRDGHTFYFYLVEQPKANAPYVLFADRDYTVDLSGMDLSIRPGSVEADMVQFVGNYSNGSGLRANDVDYYPDEERSTGAAMHACLRGHYSLVLGITPSQLVFVDEPAPAIPAVAYHAMLDSRKAWSVETVPESLSRDSYANGTTVLDGKEYYVMETYSDGQQGRAFVYWREEGRRVYAVNSTTGEECLMYDFTLTPGQEATVAGSTAMRCNSVDTIRVNGSYFRRFNMSRCDDDSCIIPWVEGVGSPYGVDMPGGPDVQQLPIVVSFYCRENGMEIFTPEGFTAPAIHFGATSVASPRTPDTSPRTSHYYFDLQGRRLKAKPAKGVYIQDGRKHVVR